MTQYKIHEICEQLKQYRTELNTNTKHSLQHNIIYCEKNQDYVDYGLYRVAEKRKPLHHESLLNHIKNRH